MDLNTLASNLRARASADSTIVLDAEVFPGPVLAAVRSAFALPPDTNLTITGVKASDIPDPTAEGVLTIRAGTVSVLKQSAVPLGLTFTAPGGELQAVIVAEMGASWKFSESFDGFDAFPFNVLATSGARFVYATAEQPAYEWPGDSLHKIGLAPGLNFLSQVTLDNASALGALLGKLIEGKSLKFYGPLAPVEGQQLPVGTLRAPVGEGTLSVGVAPNALTMSNPAVAVRIEAATEDAPLQQVDLLVEADFQETLQVAVGIPMTGGALEVSTTPLPNHGSINDIIRSLPGGQNFTDFIPKELSDVFKDVGLDNFSLIVSPEPKVTYVGLSIGTLKPWPVIPGVLMLEDLSLEVQTVDPTGFNWTRVHIGAKADFLPNIFTGRFAFTVDLEKLTTWQVSTVSGAYYGSVSLGKIVRGLLGSAGTVPAALNDIQFSDFGVSATRSGQGSPFGYSFYGSVEAAFPVLDRQLTSALNLAVTKTEGGHTIHLGGGLAIGDHVFKLSLDLGAPDSKLTAKWETAGTPLGFGDIASAFGWDSMPELPEGLDLGLKDAEFTYDFKAGTIALSAHSVNFGQIVFASLLTPPDSPNPGQRVYLFSLDVPLNLKFSELPLVGESLRTDTPLGVDELQIIAASAGLAEKDLSALNKLLTGTLGDKPLIPTSLGAGFTLAAMLQMGGPQPVVVPLTGSPRSAGAVQGTQGTQDARTDTTTGVPAPVPPPPPPQTASAYQSDATWFTLQKTLGPVYFDKVGVQYQEARLSFLLNAALSAAGLTLTLEGLGVSSPLNGFEPRFELRGLGIDYKGGEVEIGGAFLRTVKKGQPDRYDGAAVIKTKQAALAALGSYTRLDGQHPSLFIYAVLDYPLGGPAFFFVTGLAAGFGYNRRLITPSIEKVADFPLIKQAVGGREAAPKGVIEALEALQSYVPPSLGDVFLAIGVKFNSFKLIDSFALLTVEFGTHFAINLLGISTAVVPTPEAGQTVTPLAQVQIAWKATFDPADGCLGVDARLTPNSYILSRDCHLSGGYAFYSWFSGEHAGDFVQTLGGYHPSFDVPKHYPTVPRLAFDWRVSDALTIQGDAYYALTGSALMAGGHLEVLFHEGELRAWLKLGADFLISWKPYHYDAKLYVNVGASYTFDIDLLLGHVRVTISVDVGAQLHLWGPDFSGTAEIDISVITFTIAFGAGASQTPEAIKEWGVFQQSFLPAKDVCSISVQDGLLRKMDEGGTERWIISPKQFALAVNSAIPFKSAPSAVDSKKNLVTGAANVEFGVGPMAVSAADLTSELTISVKRDQEAADGEFSFDVIKKRVPVGLWGQTLTPDLDGDTFLEDVPAGVEIRPGKEPTPGETATINLSVFEYSDAYYPKGEDFPEGHAYEWEPPGSFTPSPEARDIEARRKAIRDGVGSNPRRASLLEALGVAVEVNVRGAVADDFMSAPQIGKL